MKRTIAELFFIVAMAVAVCGCGGSSPPRLHAIAVSHDSTIKVEPPTLVVATSANFGPILTDPSGRTLYVCKRDVPNSGVSVIAGPDMTTWPVFSLIGDDVVDSPDLKGPLAIITPDVEVDFNYTARATQVTYKGQPLYYYDGDKDPGQVNGQNVDDFVVATP